MTELNKLPLAAAVRAMFGVAAELDRPDSSGSVKGASYRDLAIAAISAYLTTARRVPEPEGWRDIATASKNGTAIWGCNPKRAQEGKVAFINGEWEAINFSGFGTGTGFYPTHWRHLPALPAPPEPIDAEKM